MDGTDNAARCGADNSPDGHLAGGQPTAAMTHEGLEDRRSDYRLTYLVEMSLLVDRAFGQEAAKLFLQTHLVPDPVSLRVLARPAYRRKPILDGQHTAGPYEPAFR